MSLPRYLMGLLRLRFGFCPRCNSSPPLAKCMVCGGDRAYGPEASAEKRARWRTTWWALRRVRRARSA